MSATVGLWEHFRRLGSSRGREDRASFWPYAALAFVMLLVVSSAIFIPMMARSMRAMQDYALQHPEQVTVTSGPGQYSISVHGNPPGLMPSAESMGAYLLISFGLAFLLYSAAVARRLHDRGKSGAWGLMPLPFIAYSAFQMPRFFQSAIGAPGSQPDMALFFSIFFSNMLYLVTLIALIVLLAGKSDPGPNRYDRSAESL